MQRPASMDFMTVHAHPWLLMAGLAVFPRLTLLFFGGPFGVLHWLGWAVAPHVLVAVLATSLYWHTNPVLCVIAWFIAFAGTGGESSAARRAVRWSRPRSSVVAVTTVER